MLYDQFKKMTTNVKKPKWFIAIRKFNKTYYVADIDEKSVLWTQDKNNAKYWFSENYMHAFVKRYLKGKDGIFFVCQ